MKFIDLFPTTILGENLSNISSLKNQEYYNFLSNPKTIYIPDEDGVGGHTAIQNLLNIPIFSDLKTQIFNYARLYLDKLGHKYEDIQIINSWGTKTVNGQKSNYHNHSNSYISGVYYLSNGSNILFFDPQKKEWFFHPEIEYNEENPLTYQSYYITPTPSLLLLFPSYLYHQIEKHKGPDRFSIAFNIIPKGEFGPFTGKLYL
jgi:uncharacterized protein (TIGR02466 family)